MHEFSSLVEMRHPHIYVFFFKKNTSYCAILTWNQKEKKKEKKMEKKLLLLGWHKEFIYLLF